MRRSRSTFRLPTVLLTIGFFALSFSSLARAGRTLSFEERVRAQEAIERVFYAHQIGTTKRFEEAVPQSLLEEKVRTYLRESALLQRLWNTPLSAEALRAEIERIAAQTRMPGTLSDLYDALNHDALLVQECLARPALVHRLARGFFAFDQRAHQSELNEAEAIRGQLENGSVRQERDAYLVSLASVEDGQGVPVAAYRIAKTTTWDVWWVRNQDNLDGASVEPVAESWAGLPQPSGGAVDPDSGEPTLDVETAVLALEAAIDADGDGYTADVDCDDTRAEVYPGAPQMCDERNNDCADPAWPIIPEREIDNHLYPDADGDGAGSLCDCNDGDLSVYPGANESCDGRDNDCDGLTDLDTPGLGQLCDTHELGDCAVGISYCTGGVPECHRIVTPRPETCDGRDNDCDGELAWYEKDEDGDGWRVGSYLGSGCLMICIDPMNRYCTGDCDDHDPNVYPYAPETCGDGVINNCVLALWRRPTLPWCSVYSWNEEDCDHDGTTQCQGDCGPTDPTVHPGATDICDGKDNNCNGWSEEADYDHDGYAVCRGDCDDLDPAVHPGAAEVCDGKDNNCDGAVESDADHDGWASCQGDCDDNNPEIHPGALDIPGDPWDQDCSGGPTCDPLASWSGHGAYVACVDNACLELKKAGLLTGKQCDEIVSEAARSQWGGP